MTSLNRILILLLLFLFFLTNNIFSQEINIQVAGVNANADLLELEGEKSNRIDLINSTSGRYSFSMIGRHQGFYRLKFDNNHWVDFIYDGKDVEVNTEYKNILDNLSIVQSESNKLFHQFIALNKSYKAKTELLNIILGHYPEKDDYYKTTEKKLLKTQDEYRHFVEGASQSDPNSFIARYIKSAQLPILDISISQQEQLNYLKLHSLDKIDFNDDDLTYSDLFSNKSIEYLTYYRNQQLPKELLEQQFMIAVDTLLYKAKVNEIVYQHMTEYLIDGFTKFGFDVIINYIVDNYVIKDDLCLDSEIEKSIQNRIDQAKHLKIGNNAPNILLPDINGNVIDLSTIKSEKRLIIFYASWCPHCKTNLPELVKLYEKQKVKNIEILAISLDEKREEWLKFIEDFNLNWLNVSDLQGWNGKAAKDYFIYATPTMFLVDSQNKIISKPLGNEEVFELFKNSF